MQRPAFSFPKLMLTINGHSNGRFCDGVARRDFLRIGGLALGGLSLPQVLRAESAGGVKKSHKAVIMIYLPGGPSHQDMYDIKEDAPREFRGEFNAIPTCIPGVRICEHMPQLAKNFDKFAVIRSITDSASDHSSFQPLTGHSRKDAVQPSGGWPGAGAVIGKLQGSGRGSMPPYIALNGSDPKGGAGGGFLGASYGAFSPSGKGRADMVLNGVTLDRLEDRKSLLEGVDRFRREADMSGQMNGMDAFNQEAFNVVTSNKLAKALDVSAEDKKVAEAYKTRGDRKVNDFLVARRLVEAGARFVTLNFGGWDTHSKNFETLKKQLPVLDQGVTALVRDLHDRGMEKDVTVVVWGEFGRTPRVNGNAGRDHWPRVSSVLLAGGGMKTGQMIGATDRTGGEAADRPTRFGEVFATLYHNMGIDASKLTIPDLAGRPQYIVDPGCTPMKELI